MARRGTNRQVRGYTNCLTSTLACTDNAQADGPVPSSPTKDLIKGHFWNREYKHLNAEVDRLAENDKPPNQSVSGLPVDDPRRASCPPRAQSVPKGHRGRNGWTPKARRTVGSGPVSSTCQFLPKSMFRGPRRSLVKVHCGLRDFVPSGVVPRQANLRTLHARARWNGRVAGCLIATGH